MKQWKALTFSYDDGVEQDKRLIDILDRYGLKCTFNLNSGLFGIQLNGKRTVFGVTANVLQNRIPQDELCEVYAGHEVAGHTRNHPILTTLPDHEVIRQVQEDALELERIFGKKIQGMAYPGGPGHPFADDRVEKLIRENTALYYGREVGSTYSFALQQNLLRFHPTVAHREKKERMELAKAFVELETETPQLFYIWGHSYELDVAEQEWADFERFCEYLAGRDDIFYGTNDAVFRHFGLAPSENCQENK